MDINNNLVNAKFNNEFEKFNNITIPKFRKNEDLLQRELDRFFTRVLMATTNMATTNVAPPIPQLDEISHTDDTSAKELIMEKISELPKSTDYLDGVFRRIGQIPDTYKKLNTVLDRAPQIKRRKLLYLVSSGLSVDIITNYERNHKDVDLVLMDKKVNQYKRAFMTTDNTVPEKFWGGLKLDNEFLTNTAFRAFSGILNRDVECVHPGITVVQKTSNAWGRDPREHDYLDSLALGYWMLGQPEERKKRDVSIARAALATLPSNERFKTADRLNTMFDRHPWFTESVLADNRPAQTAAA